MGKRDAQERASDRCALQLSARHGCKDQPMHECVRRVEKTLPRVTCPAMTGKNAKIASTDTPAPPKQDVHPQTHVLGDIPRMLTSEVRGLWCVVCGLWGPAGCGMTSSVCTRWRPACVPAPPSTLRPSVTLCGPMARPSPPERASNRGQSVVVGKATCRPPSLIRPRRAG